MTHHISDGITRSRVPVRVPKSTSDASINAGGKRGGGGLKKSPTKKEKLEAELKLLEWHKLANDAAIKAALMQTKTLRKDIPSKPPSHTSEDARWMRRVIEQEHVKPLEVSRDYVLEYERKEKDNAERLSTQVERHIATLSTLRSKLEERHDLKARQEEYRTWKKDFGTKKQSVMIGKTLQEIELENMNNSQQDDTAIKKRAIKDTNKPGELSTVLDSLGKLAELEKRITSLEKDNEYDQLMSKEKPSVATRTSFDFRKKRTPMEEGGTMGVTYALQPKKTSWNPGASSGRATGAGAGVAAVRAKQSNGGVFLTDVDDDNNNTSDMMTGEEKRQMMQRERQKQLAMASAGKKNIRSRVVAKKERMREQAAGTMKHENALKELNRRRNEQLLKKGTSNKGGKPSVSMASKGISSGIRHKNKHLQEFENMKSGYKKRKEDIMNRKNVVSNSNKNDRISSYSAPAKSSRVPAVKSGGTTTRRVNNPTANRKAYGQSSNDRDQVMTAPIVSGIGGIKLLRNKRV